MKRKTTPNILAMTLISFFASTLASTADYKEYGDNLYQQWSYLTDWAWSYFQEDPKGEILAAMREDDAEKAILLIEAAREQSGTTQALNTQMETQQEMTLLHYAAGCGMDDVVELLLESGADIDARDAYGDTPFHMAAQTLQKSTMELLVQRGADLMADNARGYTALHRLRTILEGSDRSKSIEEAEQHYQLYDWLSEQGCTIERIREPSIAEVRASGYQLRNY